MIQYVMILMMMTTLPRHKHGGHINAFLLRRWDGRIEGIVGFLRQWWRIESKNE